MLKNAMEWFYCIRTTSMAVLEALVSTVNDYAKFNRARTRALVIADFG